MRIHTSLLGALMSTFVLIACATDMDSDSPNSEFESKSSEDTDLQAEDESDEHDHDFEHDHDTVVEVDDEDESDDEGQLPRYTGSAPPRVVYINGTGRTVKPGKSSNSQDGVSSLIREEKDFPPSKYVNDPKAWGELMAAVRKDFAAYNVTIVDKRPKSGPYIEAIVTNKDGTFINLNRTTVGYAPVKCGVIENAIAFIFDEIKKSAQSTANTISHELGHTMSLSHTQTRYDLMSYLPAVDSEFFDQNALCGPSPSKPQRCICKQEYQNNHRQLLQFLGAKSEAAPAAEPSKDLAITSPTDGATLPAHSKIVVDVDARNLKNVKEVSLRWQNGSTRKSFSCGQDTSLVKCKESGGIYSFSIVVGSGTRYITAVASTAKGELQSSTSRIKLSK